MALFLWACVSLVWSPDIRTGVLYLMQCAAVMVVAALPWRRSFVLNVVSAAAVGAFVLNYVRPYAGGFGNPNFQAEFICLALPFCIANIRHSSPLALMGVVACLGVLAQSDSSTHWGALAGFLVLFMAYRRMWWTLAYFVAIGANIAAFWADDLWAWSSVHERVELWWNTIVMWLDSPMGYGVGSFNYEYYRFQEAHPWQDTLLKAPTVFAGAAHNEFLQVLATLGPLGVILACASILSLPRDGLSLSVAGVAISLAGFGFPFQSAAPLMLMALCFAISEPADYRILRRFAVFWRALGAGRGPVKQCAGSDQVRPVGSVPVPIDS